MRIVSDRGMDAAPEQLVGLDNIDLVPFTFTLDGKDYRSGIDIQPDEFYKLLAATDSFPSTSLPSPGIIAEVYKATAAQDPEVLAVHVSSGLSGTFNAARVAAQQLEGVDITLYDTKTLSGAQGWHVIAAAKAAKAGWDKARILKLLEKITAATDTVFTIATVKYLVHGGRISNMKGLAAQVLNIKPIIGVEKVGGTYVQKGSARTLSKAVMALGEQIEKQYPRGSKLRIQVLHANNPEDAQRLRDHLAQIYDANILPLGPIAPVLGAHTGPGLVGVVYGLEAAYAEIP